MIFREDIEFNELDLNEKYVAYRLQESARRLGENICRVFPFQKDDRYDLTRYKCALHVVTMKSWLEFCRNLEKHFNPHQLSTIEYLMRALDNDAVRMQMSNQGEKVERSVAENDQSENQTPTP